MADVKKEKGAGVLVYILTGVFLLILCTAVSAVALIKPYEKVPTYLNIIFIYYFFIIINIILKSIIFR